jgi:hypothetical protein
LLRRPRGLGSAFGKNGGGRIDRVSYRGADRLLLSRGIRFVFSLNLGLESADCRADHLQKTLWSRKAWPGFIQFCEYVRF